MIKKLACFECYILLIISIFAIQCNGENTGQVKFVSIGNVLMTASLAKKVVTVEEDVIINIELHNNSSEKIMLEVADPIYDFSWNITIDDSQDNIKMTRYGQDYMRHKEWGDIYRCFWIDIQPQKRKRYPDPINLSKFFVFEANHQYSIELTGSFLRGDKKINYTISGLKVSITEKME